MTTLLWVGLCQGSLSCTCINNLSVTSWTTWFGRDLMLILYDTMTMKTYELQTHARHTVKILWGVHAIIKISHTKIKQNWEHTLVCTFLSPFSDVLLNRSCQPAQPSSSQWTCKLSPETDDLAYTKCYIWQKKRGPTVTFCFWLAGNTALGSPQIGPLSLCCFLWRGQQLEHSCDWGSFSGFGFEGCYHWQYTKYLHPDPVLLGQSSLLVSGGSCWQTQQFKSQQTVVMSPSLRTAAKFCGSLMATTLVLDDLINKNKKHTGGWCVHRYWGHTHQAAFVTACKYILWWCWCLSGRAGTCYSPEEAPRYLRSPLLFRARRSDITTCTNIPFGKHKNTEAQTFASEVPWLHFGWTTLPVHWDHSLALFSPEIRRVVSTCFCLINSSHNCKEWVLLCFGWVLSLKLAVQAFQEKYVCHLGVPKCSARQFWCPGCKLRSLVSGFLSEMEKRVNL